MRTLIPGIALVACTCGKDPAETAETAAPPDDPCAGVEQTCADGILVTAVADRALADPVALPETPFAVAVGDLEGTGIAQVYLGSTTKLVRLDGAGWSVPTVIWDEGDDVDVYPAIGDLTGDGVPDLALGLPGTDRGDGQVLLFQGPVTGPLDWDSPHLELKGTAGAGKRLSTLDANGDGAPDLLAWYADGFWIRFGPLLDETPWGAETDATWTITGDASWSTLDPVDVSGDGFLDLVVNQIVDAGDDLAIATRVISGPLGPGASTLEESGFVLPPPADGVLLGCVPGDADGDGVTDLLCNGGDLSVACDPLSALFVFHGPVTETDTPDVRLLDEVAAIADIDGDGFDDLVDLPSAAADGTGPMVRARYGPIDALPPVDTASCAIQADLTWSPPSAWYQREITWFGDLDGDTADDAVFVDASNRAFVVTGAP